MSVAADSGVVVPEKTSIVISEFKLTIRRTSVCIFLWDFGKRRSQWCKMIVISHLTRSRGDLADTNRISMSDSEVTLLHNPERTSITHS